MTPKYLLREAEERDSDLVLEWRNSTAVRSMMFESGVIPRENHLVWFENTRAKPDRGCFIFEYEGLPKGVVTVNRRLKVTNTWIWGCYLGMPGEIPGLGVKMGLLAMRHFFEVMKINIVIGEMLTGNTISYKFNRKIGFREIHEIPIVKKDGSTVPAVLFVQTDNDWAVHGLQLLQGAGID